LLLPHVRNGLGDRGVYFGRTGVCAAFLKGDFVWQVVFGGHADGISADFVDQEQPSRPTQRISGGQKDATGPSVKFAFSKNSTRLTPRSKAPTTADFGLFNRF
jgi:hypothetical protein